VAVIGQFNRWFFALFTRAATAVASARVATPAFSVQTLSAYRIDPYLVWAAGTEFKYADTTNPTATILVEFTKSIKTDWLADPLKEGLPVYLADAYKNLPSPEKRRIATAQIDRNFLVRLIDSSEQNKPDIIKFWKHFSRFELAANISASDDKTLRQPPGPLWRNRDESGLKPSVLVGVVDIGCGYANRQWRGHVRALWDQNESRSPSGSKFASGFGYGREWVATSPRVAVAPNAGIVTAADEQRSYSKFEFPLNQRYRTHGTAVLGELTNPRVDPSAFGGRNSSAEVLIAELPQVTTAYSARGALSAHVLDGVAWVLLRGTDLSRESAHIAERFVINVSMGTQAGPHNGSSMLEVALDEFIEAYTSPGDGERLAIVLSAGNSFEARCHAQLDFSSSKSAELCLRVLPDDVTPSYVEIWFPAGADETTTSITLVRPDGAEIAVSVGNVAWMYSRKSTTVREAMALITKNGAGGDGLMALLAFAPTENGTAMAGLWKIKVKSEKLFSEPVHAYVERDNAMFDPARPRGRQSHFVDRSDTTSFSGTRRQASATPTVGVTGAGTLNSLATGRRTIVVGSYVHTSGKSPSRYSSAGPSRIVGDKRDRPTVCAVSDDSPMLSGINVAATISGTVTRLSGTSLAAPQVGALIAGAMSHGHINSHLKPEQWLQQKLTEDPRTPNSPIGGGRVLRGGRLTHP